MQVIGIQEKESNIEQQTKINTENSRHAPYKYIYLKKKKHPQTSQKLLWVATIGRSSGKTCGLHRQASAVYRWGKACRASSKHPKHPLLEKPHLQSLWCQHSDQCGVWFTAEGIRSFDSCESFFSLVNRSCLPTISSKFANQNRAQSARDYYPIDLVLRRQG